MSEYEFDSSHERINSVAGSIFSFHKRIPLILAHWKCGLTNAFMEGLNSVFSATKRKARGY